MLIRGIKKGDKDLRHFTFDDGDYTERNGVYYYKVNYGKNKLEGEYAEDEIAYVECDKVICLGGRKPKTIPGREKPPVTETVNVVVKDTGTVEKPKRGRPAKVTKTEPDKETIPVGVEVYAYEYLVSEIKVDHIEEFQDQLNMKGSEGWELCGFDTNRYSLFGDIHIIVVFKRKRG